MSVPFRIVQISDIHLFEDERQALLGVKTAESFDAVLRLLSRTPKPDLILLAGDLSQDGSRASYQRIADSLKQFEVPVYYVPGNHDNPHVLNEIYPVGNITHHRHIVLKNWHIILLNSQKPGCVEGFLEPSQLHFMEHCLQMYPEHHAIVVFHHQPVPVGSLWLDHLGLQNADELWSSLENYPNMRMILFAHVHQEHRGEKNGIQYFSSPSTCIQFKRNSDPFALEKLPPGYLEIALYPEGRFETVVHRVVNYVGQFDENAKGY